MQILQCVLRILEDWIHSRCKTSQTGPESMAAYVNPPYSSTAPAKEMAKHLPFKINQDVEAKSFSQGYRGAWFACKIVEIDKGGRNQLRYKLKYIHFPEEALHWSQAYQQRHRGQIDSTELMLRPLPPPIMHEKDLAYATYDGIVVVPHLWEVGDLVNWWCDDVWWEAVVIELMGSEKVKVSLFKPPLGEGGTHVAKSVQLRPSLSWSSADQWTLPISKKKLNGRPAARLVELSSRTGSKLVSLAEPAALAPSTQGHVPVRGTNDELSQNAVDGQFVELSGRVKQLVPAIPHLTPKAELDQKRISDALHQVNSDPRTIPCLDVLRVAAEPLASIPCAVEGNNPEGNGHLFSSYEKSQQELSTSSGTMEADSEDEIAVALHLRWQQFKRRNRKFKRYRKQINTAVHTLRRRRLKLFKRMIRNIIDSSEESGDL